MSFYTYYKKQIHKLQEELSGSEKFWRTSAATISLYYPLKEIIQKSASGELLDVGAGTMPYKILLPKKIRKYYSMDFSRRTGGLNYVGDVHELSKVVKNKKFNAILCTEVFEHLRNPFIAADEVHKSLKNGGILILSVPFMMPLHNEPYDYFRYTKYSLEEIFKKYKDIKIIPSGSIFSFIHYLFSSFLIPVSYILRPLFYPTLAVNWLIGEGLYRLDELLKIKKILPLRYILIAKK